MNKSALRQPAQQNQRPRRVRMNNETDNNLNGTHVIVKNPPEFDNIPELTLSELVFFEVNNQLPSQVTKNYKHRQTINSVMKIINTELLEASLKSQIVPTQCYYLSDSVVSALIALSDQEYEKKETNPFFQGNSVSQLIQLYSEKNIIITFVNFSRRNRVFKNAGGYSDFIISTVSAQYLKVEAKTVNASQLVATN